MELLLPRLLARLTPLAARIQVLVTGAGAAESADAWVVATQGVDPVGAPGDGELERLREEVDRLGWALGRVTAAADADAMGPRHRQNGLAVLLAEVEELCVVGELPGLAPGGRELWIAAALVAAQPCDVLSAAVAGGWRFTWSGAADLGQKACYTRLRDSDAQLEHSAGTWSLDVPAAWLHDGPLSDDPT
ncbi:MAG: hypothetical protein P1V81_01685 [Planctomycetota bacterium]|nr:hypothetical protein [Planctomycetota bacterium]